MKWLSDPRCEVPAYSGATLLRRVGRSATLALGLLLLLAGCGKEELLKTEYGQRRGNASASVNGTSVLAEMFREAGTRPATVINLSARMDKYDVIVWAPDDFAMPPESAREFLETWLASASGRTLVYIGRDYDAACEYWETMVAQAPAAQRFEVMRRAAQARAAHSHARIEMPKEQVCEWFVMRRDFPGRTVDSLSGPWTLGQRDAQLWSQGRLDMPSEKELATLWKGNSPSVSRELTYTPLLAGGPESLVYEVSDAAWDSSRILVVANGSFLLNLPLVNSQNRQLAGQLIAACQPCGAVAFLESQAGGPLVSSELRRVDEASLRARVLLAAHWVLLGTVFCFLAFPIFGRPKSIETEAVADFGQHVDAMASLLERTRNASYAQRQLELYSKGQRPEKPSGLPSPSGTQDVT